MKLLAIAFLLMVSSVTFADTKIIDGDTVENKNLYPAFEDRFGSKV